MHDLGLPKVRLWSKDLKTPYPKNGITRITGLACIEIIETLINFFMYSMEVAGWMDVKAV